MPKISKPFVIATEGPTVDGRTIKPEWIQQMAKSYDPKVYTAVANLEHYLSSLPDSVFSAYGKVISLSTQVGDILGEKKQQLLAVVEVNDAVVEMQKAGKKLFSSMEVTDNFASKGIAYLTGLAFTDSPASLGTESMKFAALKGDKDSIFSFDKEVEIEWEKEDEKPGLGATLLSKVKEMLGKKAKTDDERYADVGEAVTAVAESQKTLLDSYAALQKSLTDIRTNLKALADAAVADRKAFTELQTSLDKTETGKERPASAGGGNQQVTDC